LGLRNGAARRHPEKTVPFNHLATRPTPRPLSLDFRCGDSFGPNGQVSRMTPRQMPSRMRLAFSWRPCGQKSGEPTRARSLRSTHPRRSLKPRRKLAAMPVECRKQGTRGTLGRSRTARREIENLEVGTHVQVLSMPLPWRCPLYPGPDRKKSCLPGNSVPFQEGKSQSTARSAFEPDQHSSPITLCRVNHQLGGDLRVHPCGSPPLQAPF
jgi:hypothetical protein